MVGRRVGQGQIQKRLVGFGRGQIPKNACTLEFGPPPGHTAKQTDCILYVVLFSVLYFRVSDMIAPCVYQYIQFLTTVDVPIHPPADARVQGPVSLAKINVQCVCFLGGYISMWT